MTKYDFKIAKEIITKKGLKTYLFKTKGKDIAKMRRKIDKNFKLVKMR